jgi:hypothetical protein
MKTNCWLILGVMLSTSLTAQQVTSPPPAVVAPAPAAPPSRAVTKAPPTKSPSTKAAQTKGAPKSAPKQAPAAKNPVVVEKPVMLVPGPATIVTSNVNVRGQAALNSEVVTRLSKGETVTVLEQINLEKHAAGEPAQWAKIAFPTNAHAWVSTAFIDATNKTVLPRRLNLRSGPGENFSVVGLLERGAPVREIVTKGNWVEIEAPASAYAFVAAEYLKQELPVIAAAATAPAPTPAPNPTPTPVVEAPRIAPARTEAPTPAPAAAPADAPPAPPAVMPAAPSVVRPAPEAAPAAPTVAEGPLPVRVVSHEGVVRGTRSIQSPTKFEIFDPASGRIVDYLYTPTTNLDLSQYRGLRIIVTGEEGLDERWGNTPVITIQRIQVVE